jgi:transcription factor E2F3
VENSLAVVARRFIQRLKNAEHLDLNEAADALSISKRRVYDITNVLEGMGLLVKIGKNKVQWEYVSLKSSLILASASAYLPNSTGPKSVQRTEAETRVKQLQHDLKVLQSQCRKMEAENKELCNPQNMLYLYVTHDDLYGIGQFREQILIALKAPYGSTVEVDNQDMHILAPKNPEFGIDIAPLFFCEEDDDLKLETTVARETSEATPIEQLLRLAAGYSFEQS